MFFFISLLHVSAQQCPSTNIVSQHRIRSDGLDEISGISFQSYDATAMPWENASDRSGKGNTYNPKADLLNSSHEKFFQRKTRWYD